jgi:hypothetical protein
MRPPVTGSAVVMIAPARPPDLDDLRCRELERLRGTGGCVHCAARAFAFRRFRGKQRRLRDLDHLLWCRFAGSD